MKAPSLSTNAPSRRGHTAQSFLSARSSTGSGNAKAGKRGSRALSKPPIIVLSADTTNFQAMVQQLTGIPTPNHRVHSSDSNYLQPTHSNVMSSFNTATGEMNTFSHLLDCSYAPLPDPVSLPTLDTSSVLLEKHGGQQHSLASLSAFCSDSLFPSSIANFNPYSIPHASSSSPYCNPNPAVASAAMGSGGAAAAFTSCTTCMEEMDGAVDNLVARKTNELEGLRLLQNLESWLLAPVSENDAVHAIAHRHAPIHVHGA